MSARVYGLGVVFWAWLAAGCGEGGDREVTWHRDVRPIAAAMCADCHTDSAAVPFDVQDPAAVAEWADPIVASVLARSMPPWGMDASCREVPGSRWLSDAQLDTFRAWRDGGFELGDAADYVAPPPPPPSGAEALGAPDQVVVLDPYTPDTSGPDDYRCLLLGDVIPDELFLRGVRTTPSNLDIAHHVILFAVPAPALDELAALDAAEPGPGYTCFGDSGIDYAMTVGGWAPGRDGTFLSEGVAQRVPAGSQLVVQMHYNTSGVPKDDPGSDATKVELWELPAGEVPERVMIAYPILSLGMQVAPGVTDTVVARQRIPVRGELVGTTPHMHLRGRAMETTLIRPDGEEQCLSRVPSWEFGWQNSYGTPPGGAIPVSIDDEIEIACTFDNTDRDVNLTWGEGTDDEMCLDYVGVVTDWGGGTTGGVCSGYPICKESCDPADPFCAMECMTQSGDSCMFCGLEALTSDCVGFECLTDGLALSVCMDTCGNPDNLEDVVRCFHDDCRAQLESYWQCAKPVIESGACPEEFEGCAELGG
jgi:hypothetical protein